MTDWRSSTWGDEISLEYGKGIRGYANGTGPIRVFGTNGPVGWTDTPLASGPGVILGRKGAYRGVHYSPDPFYVIDTAYYAMPKVPVEMRWLYYAMIHYELGLIDDGSPIPSTTRAAVYPRHLLVPSLEEQLGIAAVLGSLDDKIEANRRTGAKLEELARGVFKAWFVDFEPVKAKAAGATAFPGMPSETFGALPNNVVDSELGRVPEVWENCVYRVAELERTSTLLIGDGYRAKRSELAETGIPFVRAGNVNGTIITDGAELLGWPAIAKAGVKRSKVWDTVFTSKGTVGRIGLVTPATGDLVYAPQVCFWRTLNRETLSPLFLHLWMKSDLFTAQWKSVKGQTDMADFVSLSDQRAMTMLLAPPHVQHDFDSIVSPMIELIGSTAAESAKLAALRDYLLPRLLSGRVRVGCNLESQN